PPTAIAIGAGAGTSCAVLADGSVRCWGGGNQRPVVMPGITGAAKIAMRATHAFAIQSDGTVMAWGRNDHGEIGDGTTDNRDKPLAVPKLRGSTEVAPGTWHTCALDATGGVRCWGFDGNGELGDGGSSDKPKINIPDKPVQTKIKQIAAGGDFSCALTIDGA